MLGAGPSGSWPVTNPVLKSLLVQFRRHRDTYQNGQRLSPRVTMEAELALKKSRKPSWRREH